MIKKLLLRIISVRFWLALALVIAGIFDLLTTLPMLRFETNPIYFVINKNVIGFIIIKFLMLAFIIGFVLYKKEKNDLRKYINITIIVLVIMVQVFAGINNLFTADKISKFEAETGKTVQPQTPVNSVMSYAMLVIIMMFYPLVACVSSYSLHKAINKREKDPIIKVLRK